MPFSLPSLPYAFDALEPVIDAKTMAIHHDKHHNAYVTKLNDAIQGLDVPSDIRELISDLSVVPEGQRAAVRNHGGGHANHSLFWEVMLPKGSGGQPTGDLASALDRDFGGLESFKKEFANAAATRFGSGWAWLSVKTDGKLCVCSTPNQDSPLMKGVVDCTGVPILGLDVWEHAYYLNYQNRRPDYIAAWWEVVNWKKVSENYNTAVRR